MNITRRALGDCLSLIMDRRGVTPLKLGSDWTASGHRVVSAKHVKDGRIQLSLGEDRFVDGPTYSRWMKTPLLPGDVLLTSEGPLGEVAFVQEHLEWCLGQRLFGLRARPDVLDGRFLSYLLRYAPVVEAIQARSSGTTVLGIRQAELVQVQLPLPPLGHQKVAASMLGALDDKIELNRRTNETLEGMARSVFKSWFVDFDPVRAKAAGRVPRGMDSTVAALFPDKFQQSNFGAVPRGWRVAPYGAGLNVVKGKSYKSDELQASATALVTLKSFLRGGGYREDGLKEYIGEYKPDQVVHPGEVVVAFTDVTQAAEVIGRPARVRADGRYSTLVASLDVGIVRPQAPELPAEYLYYCFLEPAFTDHTYAHANGSTVLHLAAGAVEKYEGIWPDEKVATAFRDIVTPLLRRQDANWAECDTLGKLRETLLPKLLSGELRLQDAERIVERAV